MAVRIRMKKLGRRHRPYYRICAMDGRAPRGGKVLEELGTYDPMLSDTDARAVLNAERISYWLSVGAQPSDKVHVLIKKYGAEGTHVEQQKAALERLAQPRQVPDAGPPASVAKPEDPPAEPQAEAPAAEAAATAEAPAETPAETPAAETVEPAVEAAEETPKPTEEEAS